MFPQQYAELETQHQQEYKNTQETDIQYPHTYKKNTEYSPPSKWEIIHHITDAINVERYYPNTPYTTRYLDYYMDYNDSIFPLDVSDYQEILRVTAHTRTDMKGKHVRINTRSAEVFLYDGTTLIGSQTIQPTIQQISSLPTGVQSFESLIFEISGEVFSGKLILERINIPNPQYSDKNHDDYYYGVEGYLLLP